MRHHLCLARAIVVVGWHFGQLSPVEHGRDGLRQLRRDGRMTLDEGGELGQDDRPDDAHGQWFAEQYGRGEGLSLRLPRTARVVQLGLRGLTIACRHAIDKHRRIAFDEGHKAAAAFVDAPERRLAQHDVLTLPGDAVRGLEVYVGAVFKSNRHGSIPRISA